VPVVTCPGCRCDLRAPAGSEGNPVRCPKCRTRFSVPDRRPALPPDEAGPGPRSKAPAPAARGLFLAACFFVTVLSLAFAVAVPVIFRAPEPEPIPYEVLRDWRAEDGAPCRDVLVSERATKRQVLALAEALRGQGGFRFIAIMDSREAWAGRLAEPEPKPFFYRHFLATVSSGPAGVVWLAEGRDH
jgi:hypothetical protein